MRATTFFERDISAKNLELMFQAFFTQTMEGIVQSLKLSAEVVEKHIPSNVDVQVRIIDASDFVSDGRPSETATKLKKRLVERQEGDDTGIFDEINELHAAQGGERKLVRKPRQLKIAEAFLEEGSWYTATAGDTIFVLLIRPDHLSSADHHLAGLAGLKKKEVPQSMLGAEALSNIHLARHLGDNAYNIAMRWLAEIVGPKLIAEIPEDLIDEATKRPKREVMKEAIDILTSPENFAVNRAQRFEELMKIVQREQGQDAAQQFQDALMFHALAHGGHMDMLLGKLMDMPYLGLQQLRQAFAVHQHGLENADPAVVKAADFLSVQDDDKAVEEAIKLFRLPVDELKRMGFAPDMVEFLHHTKRKFARSDAVRTYMNVLRNADKPDALADIEKVVPFLFHYVETQALRMDAHAKLRSAVQLVANGKATDETHAQIDELDKDLTQREIIEVYSFVLAQRYLDAVKNLMPEKFPTLAPSRGRAADERMNAIKQFLAADWSSQPKQ